MGLRLYVCVCVRCMKKYPHFLNSWYPVRRGSSRFSRRFPFVYQRMDKKSTRKAGYVFIHISAVTADVDA